MRVLHVTPSYKPAYHYGGPTVSVSRLAEAQADAQVEVTVFTTTADGATELQVPVAQAVRDSGVTIWYFSRWTGDHGHFSPALLLHLWRHCRKFDVVNIHSWWNWVAFGAACICRLRSAKTIISPHGMLSPYTMGKGFRYWFQRTIGRWLVGEAAFGATSKQERLEIQSIIKEGRFYVAPNIVTLPDYPMAPRIESAEFRLLFLSRVHHKKGLEFLLDALHDLHQPWHLTIAGEGTPAYEQKLRKRIAALGLAKQVTWAGWVRGDEKWQLIAASDLMVLPSYNENFANVVLESLALGTPVLLSNQVGLWNYVQNHDLGWVTERTVPAIHAALNEAIDNPEKRARIRLEAPQIIRESYDPATIVSIYLDYYNSL
ncbi:MAG: glycosyltransferase [Saprospiraceae bacterium]|nr:glycosyltransferase [Saprospiraceae bacterium]